MLQVIHGTMEEKLAEFPAQHFDLVVTSPPYADKRKKVYGGIPANDYADWLLDRASLIMDKLKDDGSFILNVKEGAHGGVRQPYLLEFLLQMSRRYRWVETFVWVKTNPYPTGNKRRLKDAYEYCYQFCRTKDFRLYPDHCLVPADPKWAADNARRRNKGEYSPRNGSGLSMSRRVSSESARPSNVIDVPVRNPQHCTLRRLSHCVAGVLHQTLHRTRRPRA